MGSFPLNPDSLAYRKKDIEGVAILTHSHSTNLPSESPLLSSVTPSLYPSCIATFPPLLFFPHALPFSLYLSVFLPPSPFLNSWIAQPEIIAAELALPTTEKRCQPSRSIVAPHVAGTMTTALAPADSGPSLTPVTEKDVLMFWWDGDYNAPRAKIWILHILRCTICGKSKKCGGKKCMLSRIQAHDRIDCDLVTHFPHATPHPPQSPLVFPSQHPATKRWGSVSLLWDHIQSVWVVCFPRATETVLQCAAGSNISCFRIGVRFILRWP